MNINIRIYDKIVFCVFESIFLCMHALDSVLTDISWGQFATAEKGLKHLEAADQKIAQASLDFRVRLKELITQKAWKEAVSLIKKPGSDTTAMIVNSGRLVLLDVLSKKGITEWEQALLQLPVSKPGKAEVRKKRLGHNAKKRQRAEEEEQEALSGFMSSDDL